jgi:ATP-dependent DNA ligase
MLGLSSPYPPMEALSVDEIPVGDDWQYEPKWDGFRCLAFRDRGKVELQSKSGQPLARYFPELVEALLQLKAERFVLDGEIIVPVGKSLSFDQLLQRLHPAESRVRKLSRERPATLVVFDLLVDAEGEKLVGLSLDDRRKELEQFAKAKFYQSPRIELSPMTTDLRTAKKWFASAGSSLDGIIAKRRDVPYLAGERDGMVKVKPVQTVDCVVGGFRYATAGEIVGSLLLGLFDEEGLLHHVGFTSSLKAEERAAVTPKLEKLIKPPGFTGSAPGGPSRWSTKRSIEWQPLATKLVVEVTYDHFTGGRFRHGAKFLRWRPDKNPKQCTFAQLRSGGENLLRLLKNRKPARKSATARPKGRRTVRAR